MRELFGSAVVGCEATKNGTYPVRVSRSQKQKLDILINKFTGVNLYTRKAVDFCRKNLCSCYWRFKGCPIVSTAI